MVTFQKLMTEIDQMKEGESKTFTLEKPLNETQLFSIKFQGSFKGRDYQIQSESRDSTTVTITCSA